MATGTPASTATIREAVRTFWLKSITKITNKEAAMGRRLLIVGAMLLMVSLLAVGCSTGVSQQDYDQVKADLAHAQQQVVTANGSLSDTQATLSDTESTLSSVSTTLSNTQAELNILKAKCPPGDFATVSQLESWVSSHVQPTSSYAEQWFRGALKVQEAGLKDGYLISIDIDYDVNTDMYIIGCNAIAAGSLYWWNTETTTVYPWGAEFTR